MATETHQFATFPGVVCEYDINTANWRVSAVRVINNSSRAINILIKKAGVSVFQTSAPANQTTSWNTSGIQLAWQEPYWNNITETWDEAGIELFDYEIGAGWSE